MKKLYGVTTTMDEEDMRTDANGSWSRTQIRKEIKRVRKKSENNEEMVSEIYDFIFQDEGVEGRSVVDDLMLFRTLYNRFSGFATILGFVIGVFTVGVPIVLGIFKLIELIKSVFIK